jgi:outer membrane protein
MRTAILACGSALLLAAPAPALAQEREDVRLRVGLGAQVWSSFIGADDREVAPLFDIDVASGDEPFRIEAPDDSFGLRLFTSNGVTFGPAANIESSRKESDVGAPVGRVKTTLEVGAFGEVLPSESLRLRTEVLKGVNGHEGLTGSIAADYIRRDGDRYAFTFGPRLLLSDARYQRAYFGVGSAAALATGLPAYRPDGGIHAIALASGLTTQFGERWGLFGYARAERLVGNAAKSPIVREYGSRNQLSAGLGLSYAFRINR